MDNSEIESTIRTFMTDELMIEQANEFGIDDEIELDSLDQTELRVFLNQNYKIETDVEKLPSESIRTLNNIISAVNVTVN
jgi:acyl carrier protein